MLLRTPGPLLATPTLSFISLRATSGLRCPLSSLSICRLRLHFRHPSSRLIIFIALQVLLTAINFILTPCWLWPVEIHTSRDLGGGTAMSYTLTPPLVLEAVYLAASSAPVDLPVILPSFVCDWCLLFGTAWTFFVSPATCVERLVLRCTRWGYELRPFDLWFCPH